jgi:hypothetical protein
VEGLFEMNDREIDRRKYGWSAKFYVTSKGMDVNLIADLTGLTLLKVLSLKKAQVTF